MSESEARAQAFVSGFCISDGRGMLGRPHGPWTNLALCGFGPIPIWGSICGMGAVLSVCLPHSKAEHWGGANGQHELWLKIGA